jgi:hypothetical protein
MLNSFLALALAAAPAPSAHQSAVEQAIFDICPRALSGALSLEDPAQVAAAGYSPAPPRDTPGGPMPQMQRGTGTERIMVSARREGGGTCAVWFGGSENRRLVQAVRRQGRAAGDRGGNVRPRGDGTSMQIFRQSAGTSFTMTIIDGNAGGDLDFEPVTTVVLMSPRD